MSKSVFRPYVSKFMVLAMILLESGDFADTLKQPQGDCFYGLGEQRAIRFRMLP